MYKIEKQETGVATAKGFFCDGVSAGLKPNNGLDIAFIYSDTECDIASKFTTNKMQAAPIKHFLQKGNFRTNFILVNSKNANAMTGKKGIEDIEEILSHLQTKFKEIKNPVMSSTGVIGVRIPKEKIMQSFEKFDLTSQKPNNAAKAIMTTDTFSKEYAYTITLENGESFSIGAMAKGAGMINPAMATMLCFITTDADIPKEDMQELLDEITPLTFNAASVDGDTSTNDTVMLLANKKSGSYDKEAFKEALHNIMLNLAKMMVKDGEGATKLVTFRVTGAKNDQEAQKAAKALTNSLLVKTALYGEDPNWGRIASTIGASGIESYEEKLTISFDDICVYEKGKIYFDTENEAKAAKVMQKDEFCIHCDIGIGDGNFTAYGCDLGHEYVKINADYRT
ncbi:MAG: bifunctional glutamate N-acetyltransferase/amino-acid acetyltransferase ArgJ [Epsilonproteobacteria bacterium]|nr:bifunctional glutamate N-acetyltransferase/amino-acid acetyltransferase ArgJ [Campylobacterota bacterium]